MTDPRAEPQPPHDVPSAADLVAAVAEFLRGSVLDAVEGELRYLLRVSINVLGVVERELLLGSGLAERHRARLAELGCADEAQLAELIRSGRLDAADPRVRELVEDTVRDKLLVADPRVLDEESGPTP